jgi:hypothetical protein
MEIAVIPVYIKLKILTVRNPSNKFEEPIILEHIYSIDRSVWKNGGADKRLLFLS